MHMHCFLNLSLHDDDKKADATTTETTKTTRSYLELAKARLSALVVLTTAVDFIAAGQPIGTQWEVLASCLVGTALCSSSAAAYNQIIECNIDARMKRTHQRPLVQKTLSVPAAQVAAAVWGVSGTALLYVGTDPLTVALGAGNLLLYAGLYTYLKPRSLYNTWVGAVVGAIPPVMGWTAATHGGVVGVESLYDWAVPVWLGTTLYVWQMPHFFALSYMHRLDYQRGQLHMLPALEPADGTRTANIMVRYTWYLSTLPLIAAATNLTSSMFAWEGIVLNAYALHVVYRFRNERTNAHARKVFLTSLWYLPCVLTLFLLHSKIWDQDENEDKAAIMKVGINAKAINKDAITQNTVKEKEDNDKDNDAVTRFLSQWVHRIRNRGHEYCVHEHVAVAAAMQGTTTTNMTSACPVTLAKRQTTQALTMVQEAAVMAATAAVSPPLSAASSSSSSSPAGS